MRRLELTERQFTFLWALLRYGDHRGADYVTACEVTTLLLETMTAPVACEYQCAEHIGEVRAAHVTGLAKDGIVMLCEAARERERTRGCLVEASTSTSHCDWCDREATSFNAGDQYCDSAECDDLFRKDAPKKERTREVCERARGSRQPLIGAHALVDGEGEHYLIVDIGPPDGSAASKDNRCVLVRGSVGERWVSADEVLIAHERTP